MAEDKKPVEEESFVLIKFEGMGKAAFTFAIQNVSPAQILGATSILEIYAKNAYIQEENSRREHMAQTQLSVPKGEILVGRQ